MTEYIFRRKAVVSGDKIEIPDNARDISFEHREELTIVCYFEKQGESVI
ncbi:hypothetical protein M199_gp079 [Halogranum tailed virus 1]|uniref:Uncharacterized protein n=1 Tax=Halogranum tailed virus 1 TaxID=1273749 RepID=R4TLK4_9CAUD|nr:hypothetical protein M199_gp079 [Halogranum tailed virus 1]AGM11587.1 hypothetical protein HGTV1_290 [Halogranum tailed virus 1]